MRDQYSGHGICLDQLGGQYHVLDAPLAVLDGDDADVDSLLGVSGDSELGKLTNENRVFRALSNE